MRGVVGKPHEAECGELPQSRIQAEVLVGVAAVGVWMGDVEFYDTT